MKITVRSGSKGLLFRAGTLVRVLEPGAYRLFPRLRGESVELVDVRERATSLDLAPLMTRDNVPVGVAGFVAWRIVDPTVVVRVGNVAERLDQEARAAAAGEVARVPAMNLAWALRSIAADVQDRLALEAQRLSVKVVSLGLTDVRFPRRLRRMLKSDECLARVVTN